MKKDCSNIFVFKKEWERRRAAKPEENWTPITKLGLWFIDEEDVKELQKWSDEHQATTRAEKFLQMFPNARMQNLSPCMMDEKRFLDDRLDCKVQGMTCDECEEKYWNEEVEEEE